MILVTGGAGYIGSHFIQRYLERNPERNVVVIDNLSMGHPEALDYSDRIVLVEGEIGDTERMNALLVQYPIDTVVHFAASCQVGESQLFPDRYMENNVVQTLRLLKVLAAHEVQRFVFSSTCATYGYPTYTPIDEQHSQKPINVYGMTKLMIEQALEAYRQTHGLAYVALRYFNAAGADDTGVIGESHEPESHLIPLILQVALGQREHISIFGEDYDTPDGTCIRDYIHVTDLADAHCQAIAYIQDHPNCGEAINLGTTSGSSVKTVIDRCRAITGHPIPTQKAPRRPGDPGILVANADKAKSHLNWQTRYDLDAIIESAWRWEQNRRY